HRRGAHPSRDPTLAQALPRPPDLPPSQRCYRSDIRGLTYIGDSTDDWSTYAARPSASATSPTTSPDRSSRPAASGRGYTLDCEEPIYVRGHTRTLAGIDLRGAHPGAQRLGMNIQLGRDTPDRPMLRGRVSDRLQRHPRGPLPQHLAVLPRCCHSPSSFLESEPAPNPGRNRPSTSTTPTAPTWAPADDTPYPNHSYPTHPTHTPPRPRQARRRQRPTRRRQRPARHRVPPGRPRVRPARRRAPPGRPGMPQARQRKQPAGPGIQATGPGMQVIGPSAPSR